jgi:hypothetical protein
MDYRALCLYNSVHGAMRVWVRLLETQKASATAFVSHVRSPP